MSEARTTRRAAARYGLTDPSPDDVLMARWPLYNQDAIHTKGYHRMYDLVMKRLGLSARVDAPCKMCGTPLPDAKSNRRYCSPKCAHDATNARVGRYVPAVLEGDVAARVIAMYRAGATTDEIAMTVKRGKGRISATLRAAGILRGKGKRRDQRLPTVGKAA